ncbi:MAG: hypothetical protein ABFD82_11330 [Syntrophaceae bacterium]
MVRSTKILIHDDKSDAPEFLLKLLTSRGYRAGYAKNETEIHDMLLNGKYDVVLTNGKNKSFDLDLSARVQAPSVFVIGITNSHNQTQDLNVDIYLSRPLLISELWRAIETPFQL